MKKTVVFGGLLVASLASLVQAEVVVPPEALAVLSSSDRGLAFEAINHVVVNDQDVNDNPFGPFPGDTFVVSGFGKFVGLPDPRFEFTYHYNIAGVFTGLGERLASLAFSHGLPLPGVDNQLNLYVDNLEEVAGTAANTDDANSYVDGLKVATFEVLPLPGDHGEVNALGGEDRITFKLVDDITGVFTGTYGLTEDRSLVLAIESVIQSVDLTDPGNPQPYNFGTFECGTTPFDACGIETGTGQLQVSHVPLPAPLGMALAGFSVMGWIGRGKNANNQRCN